MSRKLALVIGNSIYNDSALSQLKTPSADVRALAELLSLSSIGGFDEVTTLVDETEGVVRRAISTFFVQIKPDDLLLLYFSGHGLLDDQGRLFLALRDTQRHLLKATSIASGFITEEMDTCRSKRQLLILDCCHSGAFARGAKGNSKAVTRATFEGNGYGRVVLTASDATQYAWEGNRVVREVELSLFTQYLVEGLRTGEADANRDGVITLDEWYDYAYDQVVSRTPSQRPSKWIYKQQGELVIAQSIQSRTIESEKLSAPTESVEVNVGTLRFLGHVPGNLLFSRVSLLVDNKEVGAPRIGQTIEIRLPAGSHTAVAVWSLMRSNEVRFEISGAETISLLCQVEASFWVNKPVLSQVNQL